MVYRFNLFSDRFNLWRDICSLGDYITGDWIIVDDFNIIFNSEDRLGVVVNFYEYADFKDCLVYNRFYNI